jgi:hypothetical protein
MVHPGIHIAYNGKIIDSHIHLAARVTRWKGGTFLFFHQGVKMKKIVKEKIMNILRPIALFVIAGGGGCSADGALAIQDIPQNDTDKRFTRESSSSESVKEVLSGANRSFATTFDTKSDRHQHIYACGYSKEMVQKIVGDRYYFVALNSVTYDAWRPKFCGRWMDITINHQCAADATNIDRGECPPGKPAKLKNIQAMVVDRCEDALKCREVDGIDNHAINEQDIRAHIDLGPKQTDDGTWIGSKLGEIENYDVTWRWNNEKTFAKPLAFIVQNLSDLGNKYFRLGLLLPHGIIRLFRLPQNEELQSNGPQAQYAITEDWQQLMAQGGLELRVEDFSSKDKCYRVTSKGDQTWNAEANEKYYKAEIAEINCR